MQSLHSSVSIKSFGQQTNTSPGSTRRNEQRNSLPPKIYSSTPAQHSDNEIRHNRNNSSTQLSNISFSGNHLFPCAHSNKTNMISRRTKLFPSSSPRSSNVNIESPTNGLGIPTIPTAPRIHSAKLIKTNERTLKNVNFSPTLHIQNIANEGEQKCIAESK